MGVTTRGRQYLLLADEDLISLVENDEPEAFSALYDRHSRAAYPLAYRMMGDVEIAGLLNLPLGTVKGRMRLGLQKLRGLPVWQAA